MAEPELNDDFRDLLHALDEREVDFVIVGAHAMAVHGVARATGDIDILVRATAENALRVVAALRDFGAPLGVHGATVEDFTQLGWVYQMGLPPRRIDLLTSISGVSFDEAWQDRCSVEVGELTLPFIGLAALRTNKLATGRPKDLADVAMLDELPPTE
ncbi:MAG: hypothetical protein ACJAYU_000470 [Bradymonadia bacterium]|jgi:hypothetical protein